MNKTKRSEVLDIAKGIGIILVVWGHANGPGTSYINQFHMPLFFLISGYLYNEKTDFNIYLIRKTKNLYIPFIFWNILSLTLTKIFNINSFTLSTYLGHILKVLLTLSKDSQFFGATWFLGALFIVSVLYKLLDIIFKMAKLKKILVTLIFLIISIISFNVKFPSIINRTIILSLFFAIGSFIRKYNMKINKFDKTISIVLLVPIALIFMTKNEVSMRDNTYTYKILFVVNALIISYTLIYISRFIDKSFYIIKSFFIFIGKNSIVILLWHLVVFRFVILLQLYLYQLPLSSFLDYYPYYLVNNGWWIVYTIVGLVVPLIIGKVLKMSVWGNFLTKIYVIR